MPEEEASGIILYFQIGNNEECSHLELDAIGHGVHPRCDPKGLGIFGLEVGGDMFIRNVCSYRNHTESSHPRKQDDSRDTSLESFETTELEYTRQ
jgi:hypothetical protein